MLLSSDQPTLGGKPTVVFFFYTGDEQHPVVLFGPYVAPVEMLYEDYKVNRENILPISGEGFTQYLIHKYGFIWVDHVVKINEAPNERPTALGRYIKRPKG